MVCCDVCQRWVHCHCDGISDEKYLQFQVDNHLQYSCATCRGECYQVRDLEDAVQELWRRRDKADQDLIASLRAAAGLPTQEEIFAISPYSDDDDDGPPLKKEYGHSLKFSLKGLVDKSKSPKKNKEYTKKSANKKSGKEKGFLAPNFGRIEPRVAGHSDAQSIGSITSDNGESDMLSFPVTASLTDGVWPVDQAKVPMKTERNKMKNYMSHQLGNSDDSRKDAEKSKNTKGRKLVIHLGGRNKNVANSPRSDASNSLPEQVLNSPNAGTTRETLHTTDEKQSGDLNDDNSVSHSSQKELKPLLRLKFKNPYSDDHSSWVSPGEEDKSYVKGQRSKRKRPSPSIDKSSSVKEDKDMMGSIMDAKWIIQKLGKHAIGKTVEVHQPSNNSWHKGIVIKVSEDTSTVSVTLDDGNSVNVDLGKQGIRFVSQKQRQ